ncbi:cold shock domain-containing protein [Acinetobacter sp. ANC 4648]|uniref:cold shock domain-containing protein n=1 Tax=Acinetobacter sp. ANC 4648 TaxID=1977875 RepID=UPI000A33A029|nr:cold shock domain-containing protein [Acinetobacter sp. ANC 4648]OTG83866.1 cold-shock protein [Acinetobacter sp. ANC 4648]
MKLEFQYGKVMKYNPEKGFGFISMAGEDIFFHISDFLAAIEVEPKRNEKVKFVIEENGDKLKATRIERVDPNPAKTKQKKILEHNESITTDLLSKFLR